MVLNIMKDNKKENLSRIRIDLVIFFISFIVIIFVATMTKMYLSPSANLPDETLNSIGTVISIIGIMLAVVIFYLSEKAQEELHHLSEEIQSLSILAYKNQVLQLLLDNHLKSPKNTKERNYWHYRFSFENYDSLQIKIGNNENLRIKILGTNIAPFQSPAENIMTYMYSVQVIDSSDCRIPLGNAYCSFIDGKNKIALTCNQLDLIDPMYEFEITGPDILHSVWIEEKPKFYSRLKNIEQFKMSIHANCH